MHIGIKIWVGHVIKSHRGFVGFNHVGNPYLYPDIHSKMITKFLNKAHQSINGELTTERSIIYYSSRFGQILY